jgi:predicted membrane channel-forming protein YqfA (hemolysin III family)
VVGLTLPLNDFFPHLKHVRVFVHIEAAYKGVLIVALDKVLKRVSLIYSLMLLLIACVVIFHVLKVKVRLVRGDQRFRLLIVLFYTWGG